MEVSFGLVEEVDGVPVGIDLFDGWGVASVRVDVLDELLDVFECQRARPVSEGHEQFDDRRGVFEPRVGALETLLSFGPGENLREPGADLLADARGVKQGHLHPDAEALSDIVAVEGTLLRSAPA